MRVSKSTEVPGGSGRKWDGPGGSRRVRADSGGYGRVWKGPRVRRSWRVREGLGSAKKLQETIEGSKNILGG